MKNNLKRDFNKPKNDKGLAFTTMVDAIKAQRRDLKRKTFYVASHGNSSMTLLAGDEVFKSGRYHGCWDYAVEKEQYVLPLLENLDMPVPKLTTVGNGTQFIGMTKMPGTPLSRVFNDLSQKERNRLAFDIAAVKKKLEYGVSYKALRAYDVVRHQPVYGEGLLRRSRTMMGRDDVKGVLKSNGLYNHLNDYLDRVDARDPVAVHGDMHDNNLLIDPKTKTLTGVIDFGSLYLSILPEHEFHGMRNQQRFASYSSEKQYTLSFVNTLQREYAAVSDIIDYKDILCYKLIYEMEKWSTNRDAPWTKPRHEGYSQVMNKIQKIGPKILAQSKVIL